MRKPASALVTLLCTVTLAADPGSPSTGTGKVAAQSNPGTPSQNQGAESAKAPAVDGALMAVTLEPSRPQSVLGTRLGIVAEIKNISRTALRLFECDTVIVPPPEILSPDTGRGKSAECARFPTEGNSSVGKTQEFTSPDREVIIQPGETYRALWELGEAECSSCQSKGGGSWQEWVRQRWQRLLFIPGPYKIYFEARFQLAGKQTAAEYHTVSTAQQITFSAAQSVILLGAAIGGLLAWLVKRYTPRDSGHVGASATQPELSPPALKRLQDAVGSVVPTPSSLRDAFGAMLLSLVMVVLATRISDAFPIKVNANDFWGALTLGFIANYTGAAMLQKITGARE